MLKNQLLGYDGNEIKSDYDDLIKKNKLENCIEYTSDWKESSFISIKQAEQYREAYPNITESNYVEVFKFTEQAKIDSDAAKSVVHEAEQELRSLGGAIAIAAKVQAGTYVQELVSSENIHRNADILPNGVFQL